VAANFAARGAWPTITGAVSLESLKVVTYNIKSGIYHPDGLDAIVRVLEPLEADVIGLQEVDRGTRRSRGEDQTALLARRLGMPYYQFGPATPWEGGGEYGVALLSRHPLESTEVVPLWVPTGKDATPGEREPRVALCARLHEPRVRLLVTHLGLTREQRLRQTEQLVGIADASAEPVVLMGDLNGRPDDPEILYLCDRMCDSLGHLPEEERITFPSGDPELHEEDFLARTLDYVFVSSGDGIVSARVVAEHTLASDHNPLEAQLAVSV